MGLSQMAKMCQPQPHSSLGFLTRASARASHRQRPSGHYALPTAAAMYCWVYHTTVCNYIYILYVYMQIQYNTLHYNTIQYNILRHITL